MKFTTVISGTVLVMLSSTLLAVVLYLLFCLIFPTDVEKRLAAENALLRRELPNLERQTDMLAAEIGYLRERDAEIYRSVFKADIPSPSEVVDKMTVSGDALALCGAVEAMWREIFDTLSRADGAPPVPIAVPLAGLQPMNVGASTGERLNPFYKVKVHHNGVDIVAPASTPVYAPARGIVSRVSSSQGGNGKAVEITHAGGYVTRYCHLESVSVKKGRTVKAGAVIGKVGDSGRSFTTHLHYEVLHHGEVVDPLEYFLAGVTPTDYLKMLVMGASSGQSMD